VLKYNAIGCSTSSSEICTLVNPSNLQPCKDSTVHERQKTRNSKQRRQVLFPTLYKAANAGDDILMV
jgi:hypothetical protein